MTPVEQHIEGFKKLGQYLREIEAQTSEYAPLFECIQKAQHHNGWFTQENCLEALRAWGEVLHAGALQEWTRHRPELEARGFGSGTEPTKRSQQSIVAELEGTNRDLFEAQGKLLGAKKGSPERRDLLGRAEGIEIRAVHPREELAGAFDAISKA